MQYMFENMIARFEVLLQRVIYIICLLCAMTSVAAWGQKDVRYTFPKQFSVSPKQVNLQTGRFIYSKVDLQIGNLKLERVWGDSPTTPMALRSFGTAVSYFESSALGWQSPNASWQNALSQGVQYWPGDNSNLARRYVVVDGQQYTFAVLPDGFSVPADQSTSGANLTLINGQWVFTDRSGNVFTFYAHPGINQSGFAGNPIQVLLKSAYADGSLVNYAYNSAAQPKSISSNSGYAINLDYDANGNITTACGYNLAQTYADALSNCTTSNLKVRYGYSASGQVLTSVTDVENHVFNITSSALPLFGRPAASGAFVPTCITLADSAVCEIRNAYGAQPGDIFPTYDDQVRVQTTATGDVWQYKYSPQPDPADQPVVIGQPRYNSSTMIDPLGQGTTLRYDRGHLISELTAAGKTAYLYATRTFTPPGINTLQYHDAYITLLERPEGNREYFGHDGRGNVTLRSYWPKGAANPAALPEANLAACCVSSTVPVFPAGSVTSTQTFLPDEGVITVVGIRFVLGCGVGPVDAKLCDKPLARIDERGNQSDYTYDRAHGGILTETAPTVNGVRPQTRYSYTQRYAWVKGGSGAYVQGAAPIWVLTKKSICKAGAASGAGCALAGDEVVTAYEYGPDAGPNNLLLRGTVEDATGAALRTCYSYDWRGNKLSTTTPRANLGVCP